MTLPDSVVRFVLGAAAQASASKYPAFCSSPGFRCLASLISRFRLAPGPLFHRTLIRPPVSWCPGILLPPLSMFPFPATRRQFPNRTVQMFRAHVVRDHGSSVQRSGFQCSWSRFQAFNYFGENYIYHASVVQGPGIKRSGCKCPGSKRSGAQRAGPVFYGSSLRGQAFGAQNINAQVPRSKCSRFRLEVSRVQGSSVQDPNV